MKIVAGSRYKNSFKLSEDALKPNRLFLTCTANYTNILEISEPYEFFATDLILHRAGINEPQFDNWYEYTVHLIENNPEIKGGVLRNYLFIAENIRTIKNKDKSIVGLIINIPPDEGSIKGEGAKIVRGYNSLHTFKIDIGQDFCYIKIVDTVDLITDDIREVLRSDYLGKVLDIYDYKMFFIATIFKMAKCK